MSFSKCWSCTRRFSECNFSFLKNSQTHVQLISNWMRKTVWLLVNNTNMKTFAQKKPRKIFLEDIIFAFGKFFQSFHTKFLSLLYMISLGNKISHCLSAKWIIIQNYKWLYLCSLHWCYTFCTGVTLELHCTQPIRIE